MGQSNGCTKQDRSPNNYNVDMKLPDKFPTSLVTKGGAIVAPNQGAP